MVHVRGFDVMHKAEDDKLLVVFTKVQEAILTKTDEKVKSVELKLKEDVVMTRCFQDATVLSHLGDDF